MTDRGLADVIIARIPQLTPAEKVLVCKHCTCEKDVTAMTQKDLEALIGRRLGGKPWNMSDLQAQAEQDAGIARMRGIGYVSYMSPLYPPLLREIWDPPAVIFYRGRLPDPERSVLAMVGTREPSPPALLQAYDIAKALGRRGIPVISGLAKGIDSMAHRGNADGGGQTMAVLGSGLDEIYPAINRALARRIIEQGGALLSEYPPGTKPRKWHFPARNRIISALARGTVIVEAPSASGALITAGFALEHGRDLWVASAGVTEGPYDRLRGGTKKLAEQGAPVIASADDILTEWGMRSKESDAEDTKPETGEFSGSALAASLAQSLNIVYEE
ncbi:MAG: DNA-processing protein DprA [Spirochaetaceae bacterium]|jgi:DNA processing protein|nr:DNA-processing protein DprA [Spirochaetaceae bacterium]